MPEFAWGGRAIATYASQLGRRTRGALAFIIHVWQLSEENNYSNTIADNDRLKLPLQKCMTYVLCQETTHGESRKIYFWTRISISLDDIGCVWFVF